MNWLEIKQVMEQNISNDLGQMLGIPTAQISTNTTAEGCAITIGNTPMSKFVFKWSYDQPHDLICETISGVVDMHGLSLTLTPATITLSAMQAICNYLYDIMVPKMEEEVDESVESEGQ